MGNICATERNKECLYVAKEPHNVIEQESKKRNFDLVKIPVPHPGNEQQSQWLQIRKEKPDWVILWGWGVMNATAIKTAQKVGFKRNKIVGNWWAGSEVDTEAAGGKVAKGYYAATPVSYTHLTLPTICSV